MKSLILLACCIAVSAAALHPLLQKEWTSFKNQHGKSYDSAEEENFRLGVYLSNKQKIQEHNKKYEAGLVSYTLGMNHFGDKLHEEIAHLRGFNLTAHLGKNLSGKTFVRPNGFRAPSSVDWRREGLVTEVKDQGQCGGCWAFSTTGSLEGQMFKKTGRLVSLSEQNLIDCGSEYGNNGCDGGLMDQGFQYVIDHGLDTEESYPYEATDGECRFSSSSVAANARSFVDVPHNDEDALKHAVASVGPISVAINAGIEEFSFYRSGVFSDPSCDPSGLDHGVLLVGYGSEDGQDYWLIKNSWSASWGEGGYIKIARNQGNMCGVAANPSYPVV